MLTGGEGPEKGIICEPSFSGFKAAKTDRIRKSEKSRTAEIIARFIGCSLAFASIIRRTGEIVNKLSSILRCL